MEKLFVILHEDAGLLVVNKPAGLVCHPTKGDALSSLISRARLYLNARSSRRESAHYFDPKINRSELTFTATTHLVNRLDRETSGVVLIAKNSAVAGELGKIWETRAVQKEYLAVVHGHVRDGHGLVDAPLGKDEHSRVAIKDCVRPDGAPAQTEFWVEQRFSRRDLPNDDKKSDDKVLHHDGGPFPLSARATGGEGRGEVGFPSTLNPSAFASGYGATSKLISRRNEVGMVQPPVAPKCNEGGSTYSLLRVVPLTGRKHQIRLHLARLGHPVVGDKLYGGDEDLYLALVENRLTPEQRARLILPNQALHARAVRFAWRGQPVEFSCEPESWFTGFFTADGHR